MKGSRPVVVVSGGGAGIGAAVAEELGRRGSFVVTMDPLVTLDGAEQLPEPHQTTAGRIVAAGGTARASSTSVTDAAAVRALFEELVAEHGRLDAVVNTAGITRPTFFADGTEEDWRSVLAVHLDGYLNILDAALPLMAGAGRGRVVGVTSGSGWRPADAGAYACAKRAVAALTWQVGRCPPDGVSINAMSPIAVTRMVTAALERAKAAAPSAGTAAGPLFGSMPQPEEIGPVGAHLASEGFAWCSGEVIFTGGPEVAVVEPPRLLEVLRTEGAGALAHVLEAVLPSAFAKAEAEQLSGGGSNPRFAAAFDGASTELAPPAVRTCAIVSDRAGVAAALMIALKARGVACEIVDGAIAAGFDAAVVALSGPRSVGSDWGGILAEHAGLTEGIYRDAAWARSVADLRRPMRLVTLTDAVTSGGRSRAQAAAQHSRLSRKATDGRVTAFAVSHEAKGHEHDAAELVTHLLCHPGAMALSGAELVVGGGWIGLRSHPRPSASFTLGSPAIPGWFDDALREVVRR